MKRRRPNIVAHRSIDYRRTRFNHREHAFASAWERENEVRPGLNFGHGTLMGLMVDQRQPGHDWHPLFYSRHTITNRDAAIVATVVQWLATTCGMEFLRTALKACGYLIVPDQAWRDQPDTCPLCKGRGRKMREAGVIKCGWCRHPVRQTAVGYSL